MALISVGERSAEPTLLYFLLARSGIDDPVAREMPGHRAEALAILRASSRVEAIDAFEVLPSGAPLASEGMDAARAWTAGTVDVIQYRSTEDLVAGLEVAQRIERFRAPNPGWSAHVYATRAYAVRPLQPDAPLRKFTLGAALPGITRRDWLDRWHRHGELITDTPVFETHLKGYVQYHFLDASLTGELGTPDAHAVAQTAWTSVKDMDEAYALPDYREVLRTDEDNIIYKDRMIRVLATPVR